jgi:transcriptional regulator with XRE-family HTH domain
MNSRQQITSSQAAPIDHSPASGMVSPGNSFADRIRLLIQRVGSATEIARMCGFSEGVVRSWRDGNSDPSRARCVTLAKTLGISLVWLVAGEGTIQSDVRNGPGEEQSTTETRPNRSKGSAMMAGNTLDAASMFGVGDARRLDAARAILRASLSLSGGELDTAEHEQLLGELYEIMGPGGTQIDAGALLAFQQQLALRLRRGAIA